MRTNNYDFLLPFFVSHDDSRVEMTKPYDGLNGYIYATNSEILIRLPKDRVSQRYDHSECYPNVQELLSKADQPGIGTATIPQSDILAALSAEERPAFVKIGQQTFAANYLRTILAASVFLGATVIGYKAADSPNAPAMFEMGGGITILLFPVKIRPKNAAIINTQNDA